MRAEDVPDEIVARADLALSDVCTERTGDPKCACPTDEQMRVVIAAVWPLIARRVLVEAAADVYWQSTLAAVDARAARAWLRARAVAAMTDTTKED